MFRYMLGIGYDEQAPGFRHIILQPQPDHRETLPDGQERITWARGHHQSYYGDIRSGWDAGSAPHPLYDLSGRRVSPLASASQALRRGLYVSSGRKVVVQ